VPHHAAMLLPWVLDAHTCLGRACLHGDHSHHLPSAPLQQNVKRKLESLVNFGGGAVIARLRMPGRLMLPPGVDGVLVRALPACALPVCMCPALRWQMWASCIHH
jgi:hypothetical protein